MNLMSKLYCECEMREQYSMLREYLKIILKVYNNFSIHCN